MLFTTISVHAYVPDFFAKQHDYPNS